MDMEYKGFPDPGDWQRLLATSPFGRALELAKGLRLAQSNIKGVDAFVEAIQIDSLLYEMSQRLGGAVTGHALMMFYYEQGIPDKRWYESPSKDGHSIGYFPEFKEHHFELKAWFDFYADTFYYKLFSAWDLIGQLLNVRHGLFVRKVDFARALEALEKKDKFLRAAWGPVTDSLVFTEAKRIRNDIAHNYLPSTTGMSVIVQDLTAKKGLKSRKYGFGLKKYLPSSEIVANADGAAKLFETSLEILRAGTRDAT